MPSSQEVVEKAIRVRLAARRKPQKWLAAELNESPFWLWRRMNGKVAFDVDDLDRIAGVFGTSVDRLVADAEDVAA